MAGKMHKTAGKLGKWQVFFLNWKVMKRRFPKRSFNRGVRIGINSILD
jgi:hypothetical protein